MIRLNRTTEYGLMALRYMSRESRCTSAREIAELYGLPFDITAKTLQRLKSAGLIRSNQGSRGGYRLGRSLAEVSLGEFLELMEGPRSVEACRDSGPSSRSKGRRAAGCGCGPELKREVRGVMLELNRRVRGFLEAISLAELADSRMTRAPTAAKASAFAVAEAISAEAPLSAVTGASYGGQEP